jgi:alginate O-acetyltransferase complex protein AlgI
VVFNSLTFLVFLAVVLVVYWLAPLSWTARKGFLLGMSVLFYGAWRVEYLAIIAVSLLVDFHVGRAMAAAEDGRRRKALLVISLVSNLGMLAYFKYANFALDNARSLFDLFGWEVAVPRSDFLLPVGISFYTFQTLSYTIDIYRRQMPPWRSLLDFSLFVTFFPQLVAGPIVRAADFRDQVDAPPRVPGHVFVWGLTLAIWGLFQKVVLSDALLAGPADLVFLAAEPVGVRDAWLGTLAFAGQIYFDFAGYSLAAIGIAAMLGFTLPDNFRAPYAARGFGDFWRRWHISLSSWLRDYLYISLGGNRGTRAQTSRNLMATMLLGGLWHGASWNFVLWGALHGGYQVAERYVRRVTDSVAWLQGRAGQLLGMFATFLLTCWAWVPFRAPDLPTTLSVWQALLGFATPTTLIGSRDSALVALVTVAMLVGHSIARDTTLEALATRVPWPVRAVLLGVLLYLIATNLEQGRAFLYFQF